MSETEIAELQPRPIYIGEGIHTAHRARVAHVCESCGEPIPKGSMYVRHALPPNSDLGNTGWWRIVSCDWTTGGCRRYWVIDSKDLAGERHAIPT